MSNVAEIENGGKVGAPEGNANAARHGAHSSRIVRQVAIAQRRRLLRQAGLRQADLDGLALALLDGWARAQAKVELMDAHAEERGGWLDAEGNPPPYAAFYFTALNAATRALDKLIVHLKATGRREQSMVVELATRQRS